MAPDQSTICRPDEPRAADRSSRHVIGLIDTLRAPSFLEPPAASYAGDVAREVTAAYLYHHGLLTASAYSAETAVAVRGAKYRRPRGACLVLAG